jgi:hypothetical protein
MQKIMKKILLIAAIMLSGVILYAKDGETPTNEAKSSMCIVKGQITDKINGESLTGVTVRIVENDIVAYTDFDGEFTFGNLIPGTYTIETSLVSYECEEIKVTASASSNQAVNIELITISEK